MVVAADRASIGASQRCERAVDQAQSALVLVSFLVAKSELVDDGLH